MPHIGGKKAKKSSSSTKRHFTVVIGNKEHGLYVSSSPSSAARKAVSKLCATDKKRKVQFSIREITQGSKKKTYGPYVGKMKKLDKPIELKGRIIKYSTDVYLDKIVKKSVVKKGGGPSPIGEGLLHRPILVINQDKVRTKEIVAFDFDIDTDKLMLYINNKYKNELRNKQIPNGFTNIKLASYGFILIQKINERISFLYPIRSERIAVYACYVYNKLKCYAIARCASLYECENRKYQENYSDSIKKRISRPCDDMEEKILFLFETESDILKISGDRNDKRSDSDHRMYHRNLLRFKSFIYKGKFTFKSFISSTGDKYLIEIEIMDNDDRLYKFFDVLTNNFNLQIDDQLSLPEIEITARTWEAVHPFNNGNNDYKKELRIARTRLNPHYILHEYPPISRNQ